MGRAIIKRNEYDNNTKTYRSYIELSPSLPDGIKRVYLPDKLISLYEDYTAYRLYELFRYVKPENYSELGFYNKLNNVA